MNKKALVIFSGGQDSATCLAYALENFSRVYTLGFDYGQRHAVEMDCRNPLREHIAKIHPHWEERLSIDKVLPTDFFQHIEQTALTEEIPIIHMDNGLPTTFVPGRNMLFLTMAAAFAYGQGIQHIVMGVCETDSSGYPDCRDDTIKAMQVALNRGLDANIVLHTPLMWLDKCQTWQLAEKLGGKKLIDIIVEHSHTCYTGDRTLRHTWGYGCKQCPACILRQKGFEKYLHNEK